MTLIKDPELYERFAQVIFVHGVRWAARERGGRRPIRALQSHELLGEAVRAQLQVLPVP